ncbi:MAG: CHAT domain-containing protein, partial [Caldilineaceae bacterium]|nr:CHAT domain-containing protein [Caldilineaceae bacterium]
LRDAVDEAGNTPLRSDTMVGCQKILVLAAMPPSLTRVRCDMEIEKLRELTLEPGHSKQLEINTLLVVKGSNIGKALLAERPKYVHFCGHGASEGEIFFEDENGQAMPVVAGALSKLFEEFRETVSCVVLNACYSEEQAKAISKTIDYVIGVPNQIDESAAMLFSVAFYRAIAFGKEVTGAFRQAKAELAIITSEDPPVLYARGAKVVG